MNHSDTPNGIHDHVIQSGVLDRFENDVYAVILLKELEKEIVVNVNDLPLGSVEGTWLIIAMYRSYGNVLAIDQQRTIREKLKSARLHHKLNF